MPYSKAHKAQTRARILAEATHAFREEGIESVGIPAVMGRAGLTHGGFYAHFPTKDALVAAACTEGFAESAERMLLGIAEAHPEDPLRAIILGYLSRRHRDNPANGCMAPALATEIARAPKETRAAFTQALTGYARLLSAYLPLDSVGRPDVTPTNNANDTSRPSDTSDTSDTSAAAEQREDDALVLLSGMAGAVALARAVDDPDLSYRILKATRRFYLQAFHTPASQPTTE